MKAWVIGFFMFLVHRVQAQDSAAFRPAVLPDTVVKRSGERILAKVIEVNPDNLRYKRYDFQQGPLYLLPKEQIRYVVYSNGSRESFEAYVPPKLTLPAPVDLSISASGWKYFYKERRITERDMLAIAQKTGDRKINLAIGKTESQRFIQDATLIAGIGLFVFGDYIYTTNRPRRTRRGTSNTYAMQQARRNGGYLMLAGLGSEVISVAFRFSRHRHAHAVMDLYNKQIVKN